MSSRSNILGVAIAVVSALLMFGSVAQADVTGNFETHLVLIPQTTASEIALIDFDVQNALNVTFVISGLSTTLHTHFGIAGVEDVIVTTDATLGALDISAQLVFGRFAFGSTVPFYDSLHFIKKRVTASLQLGGVSFTNVATFEDTNAFVSQTPAYAFGDIISISGQTPSGVGIAASTGICMNGTFNLIKKHFLAANSVNPDCATEPKPDLLFDFETILITGVPLATGVTSDAVISCVTITACSLSTDITVSGGAIPFTFGLLWDNILEFNFAGASITLTSGAGTLTLDLGPDGSLDEVSVSVLAVLNPDTNPATLSISADAVPGVGLTDATVALTIARAGLNLGVVATFSGGPPAELDGVVFSLEVPGSLLSIEATSVFGVGGLVMGEVYLTVVF